MGVVHLDGDEEAFDFRDYIYFDGSGFSLELQDQIVQTLQQIASTPEGQDLIRNAAAGTRFAQVSISPDTNQYLGGRYRPGNITIDPGHMRELDGAQISSLGWMYPTEDGQWQDFSLQRLLVHELFHGQEGDAHHAAVERELIAARAKAYDEFVPNADLSLSPQEKWYALVEYRMGNEALVMETEAFILENRPLDRASEAAAVAFANDFMEKYYDEPRRADYEKEMRLGGTAEWDFYPAITHNRDQLLEIAHDAGAAETKHASRGTDGGMMGLVPSDVQATFSGFGYDHEAQTDITFDNATYAANDRNTQIDGRA